jgi:hypothetical protein
MSRQYPHGSANDRYKKKLFVDTGLEYMEVKARIIEPYGSPVPQPNTKEIKLINAPSHIQQLGLSSYKVTLTLLFETKLDFAEYMGYIGWGHKFYDERGIIYIGAVESIKSTPVEATSRYKAEVGLILIKKDQYNHYNQDPVPFQDVNPSVSGYDDLKDFSRLGIISTIDTEGNPVIYFRPGDMLTRAEFASLVMRTKRLIEQVIRD